VIDGTIHVGVTPSLSSKSIEFPASTTAAGPEVAMSVVCISDRFLYACGPKEYRWAYLPTNKYLPCTFWTTIGGAVCARALPTTRRDTTFPSMTNSKGTMDPSTRTTKRSVPRQRPFTHLRGEVHACPLVWEGWAYCSHAAARCKKRGRG
jgi:hypothetical protein